MKGPTRIFISYAREDYDSAKRIYESLERRGYCPWMDKTDLVGGEDWERAIVRAVRESDFFLFCASQKSVNKRGPIQREIKEALNLWNEKLEDDIFFIPVRLEPCDIPQQIRRFQWIDFFGNDGMRQIEKSIVTGVGRIQGTDAGGELRVGKRKIEEAETGKYHIGVEYPEIQPDLAPGIAEINAAVSSLCKRLASMFQRVMKSRSGETQGPGELNLGSSLDVTFTVGLLSEELVAFRFERVIYFSGATHPNSYTHTVNFNRRPFYEIFLYDLFIPDTPFVLDISNFCVDALRRRKQVTQDEWISKGAGPDYSNFARFLLKPEGVLFIFDPYQVGSYAEGRQEVSVPLKTVEHLIEPDIKSALDAIAR